MKTTLPAAITTVEEAKAYLRELYQNREHYHCEDQASDCFAASDEDSDEHCVASDDQAAHMDVLMEQIYNLPGNDGRHVEPMIFDPCGFILDLDHEDKKFMWTDHSGKEGAISDIPFANLNPDDEDTNDDNETLYEWAKEAEIGDEWTGYNQTYIRTA